MKRILLNKWWWLGLILLVGGLARFYRLNTVPVAMAGDETAFGYNAYAILKTGRDEFGNWFPLVFKSFGDFKSPFFVYFLVPWVAILGLNEWAVRVPIAICGTLTILLVYLIAKKLYKKESAALVSALLVAISPWAINFSRAGWDAMVGVFLVTLGIYLFLLGLEKKICLWLALLVMMISFYTYHAEKVAVPLLFLSGWFLFRQKLKLGFKEYGLIFLFLGLIALPAVVGLFSFSGQSRAKGSMVTDYLSYSTKDKSYLKNRDLLNEAPSLVMTWLTHSRVALAITDIGSKFLAYLSPAELFVNGDPVGRHGAVDFGVLYGADFLVLLYCIYWLVKKEKNTADWFVVAWLVIGLLPAMITNDRIHGIRSLLAIPPVYILMGLGLNNLFTRFKRRKVVTGVLWLAMVGVYGLSFLRFLVSYFLYTPVERADWWQYGYKQVVETVISEQQRFEKVVVDVPPVYGNPYIFFLFYQQYDPRLYNLTALRRDNFAFKVAEVNGFGKYQFRTIFWPEDRKVPRVLYVGTDESLPAKDVVDRSKYRLLKEIKMPDGKVVFRIVETL